MASFTISSFKASDIHSAISSVEGMNGTLTIIYKGHTFTIYDGHFIGYAIKSESTGDTGECSSLTELREWIRSEVEMIDYEVKQAKAIFCHNKKLVNEGDHVVINRTIKGIIVSITANNITIINENGCTNVIRLYMIETIGNYETGHLNNLESVYDSLPNGIDLADYYAVVVDKHNTTKNHVFTRNGDKIEYNQLINARNFYPTSEPIEQSHAYFKFCPMNMKALVMGKELLKGNASLVIHAREWFDSTYGNSYFSARVYINSELALILPFQYGYGDHYEDMAGQELIKTGAIAKPVEPQNVYFNVRKFAQDNDIKFTSIKKENCLQADCKSFGEA